MNYADIQIARQDAERKISLADDAARDAAKLIAGRLKIASVHPLVLRALKRELANYNTRTGEWK